MSPASVSEQMVSGTDFERFREYFYNRTGIHFGEGKRYFVDKRLETSMRAMGYHDFAAWFADLRLGTRPDLLQSVINQLTVNETYFLREDYQFDALVQAVLPRVVTDRARPGRRPGPVRILSLPCSTGEEPYSIALRLLEEWPMIDQVDVEINAADIDSAVLDRARQGYYGTRSVQRVPKSWLAKYFHQTADGRYQIDGGIRQAVRFHQVNLSDTDSMRGLVDFDVIFCRNVLIYFDAVSSRRAAENLYGAMRPGGYLFLGHSESMSRISPIFTACRLPQGIVYQRPAGGSS